ncbi:ferredoxin [Hymenobacter nivis]|uniref:Ferredoxin n=1 Tax=Hymenobacter nivis TaxID=1850093 RepID=A0A2Z3GQE3_9BACT|nr:ferredoxin [Hymenobacter nivis]
MGPLPNPGPGRAVEPQRLAGFPAAFSFTKDPKFVPATTITFQFKDGQPAQTHVAAAGESVLDVALNNAIQLQHNCGGVCGCSTCHVYVDRGGDDLPEISDKEEDFIDRAENPRINSRLACQCVVEAGMELTVTVPPQHFLGH